MRLLWIIISSLSNMFTVLLLAPLLEGILRKLTARVQSRQGPPLWQPYFDLLKLLGKEDLESGELPVVQQFSACLSLAATLTVACLLPLGSISPIQERADAILLIYLLVLCGGATLLAGLSAGSTYSLIGVSREMMTAITLEPLFVMAVVIGALNIHSFRLEAVLDGSPYAAAHFPWSGLIMLGVLMFSLQAFVNRVPFDIAEAETEIMEGPLMEYSGPKLALFKYAQMVRLVIYAALFINLFLPLGNDWSFPMGLFAFWFKVLLLVAAITVIAATHARLRIDQAMRYFAGLAGISLVALVLAVCGY